MTDTVSRGPGTPQRLLLVARIETTAMAARYLAFAGLVVMYALGATEGHVPDLVLVTSGAVLHNGFVHFVLYTRRYHLFLTPLNFMIHLTKVSLLVGLSGGQESPLIVLYPLLIVGQGIYSSVFHGAFKSTLVCVIAYTGTIAGYGLANNTEWDYGHIVVAYTMLIMTGWLMSNLGEMLGNVDLDAQSRAQALASSEATLRTILDSTGDPIIVYEENEFIADVNNRACEFLGVSRGELLRQRFRTYLFDDGTLPNKLAVLRSRGEYHGEAIVLKADGGEANVELHVRSFFRGNRHFHVAMLHDITEQKNLQEAARLATLRLEQANRELQQTNAIRTAFYSTVSQRLRSPLSAILGFCDLLLNEELGLLSAEQRKAVQSCQRSAGHILRLIDEPLHIEAGAAAEAAPQRELASANSSSV